MDSDKNHEVEVKNLRELVDCIQKENQQLKGLLEQAGIDYSVCMGKTTETLSIPEQGKRRCFRCDWSVSSPA